MKGNFPSTLKGKARAAIRWSSAEEADKECDVEDSASRGKRRLRPAEGGGVGGELLRKTKGISFLDRKNQSGRCDAG